MLPFTLPGASGHEDHPRVHQYEVRADRQRKLRYLLLDFTVVELYRSVGGVEEPYGQL